MGVDIVYEAVLGRPPSQAALHAGATESPEMASSKHTNHSKPSPLGQVALAERVSPRVTVVEQAPPLLPRPQRPLLAGEPLPTSFLLCMDSNQQSSLQVFFSATTWQIKLPLPLTEERLQKA